MKLSACLTIFCFDLLHAFVFESLSIFLLLRKCFFFYSSLSFFCVRFLSCLTNLAGVNNLLGVLFKQFLVLSLWIDLGIIRIDLTLELFMYVEWV